MMSFLDYFRSKRKESASVAKERLKIIVAHERSQNEEPNFMPKLKQELVDVISKYINIDKDKINVQLEREDDCSVLELSITMPEAEAAEA